MREFTLLERVFAANRALPEAVTIPPGDDMGAVRVDGGEVFVTVDQVADGVHFMLEEHGVERVGRKAVTRNLSDLAAMAVRPVGAVVAACLPRGFGDDQAMALFEAVRTTGLKFGCPVIGGDVTMWDHALLLSMTVLGEQYPGVQPVLRSGAKVGDVVCVTGQLGGSLAGHHLDFEPRLEAAHALASSGKHRPRCMIDLSDGLGRDLGHLCRAAKLSAEVDVAALPLRGTITTRPAWRGALADGEDYELCFTSAEDAVPREAAGVPVTVVGRIVEGRDALITLRLPDGTTTPLPEDAKGWEHHG